MDIIQPRQCSWTMTSTGAGSVPWVLLGLALLDLVVPRPRLPPDYPHHELNQQRPTSKSIDPGSRSLTSLFSRNAVTVVALKTARTTTKGRSHRNSHTNSHKCPTLKNTRGRVDHSYVKYLDGVTNVLGTFSTRRPPP